MLGFGRDGPEKGDVVVGVEATEVAIACRIGAEHVHLAEEPVAAEQRVGHADPMRLHGVALAVVVVPHLRVVEVAHLTLRRVRTDRREGVPTRLHERASESAGERGRALASGERDGFFRFWLGVFFGAFPLKMKISEGSIVSLFT